MPHRAYKFRFYPTQAQKKQLEIEFGQSRFVWNWALEMRTKAYRRRGERISGIDAGKLLTKIKKTPRYGWLLDGSVVCHTQKLRDLDAAFRAFFEARARYPRFKKRTSAQSVRYQLPLRDHPVTFRPGALLKLPKLGPLKVRWSRTPVGAPRMATVSRDASGRYFVSMVVEETIAECPAATKRVGVDFGVSDLAILSDGTKFKSPRHLRAYEVRLKRAQRRLARKKRGSNRYKRQRQRVAKIYARVADSRTDFLHKLSTKLINENQVICIEDLNVGGMMRNRSLAKSIADASMYELRRQLEYKAAWHGREIRYADRWEPTSKRCSSCGHVLDELRLDVREWACPKCGVIHDRDQNAALNILNTARSAGIDARGEDPDRGARTTGR